MAIKTIKKEVPDETFKHKENNKKMEIYREQNPINPREDFNLGTMATSHKRYSLGEEEADTDSHDSWEEVEASIRENNDIKALLPLYLLDHSGLRMKTTSFRSRWDSGKVGFIYVTKESMDEAGLKEDDMTTEDLKDILRAEVNTFDDYLTGEVYRYVLKDGEDMIDSCGGFYSYDKDRMFETAGENPDDYEKQE